MPWASDVVVPNCGQGILTQPMPLSMGCEYAQYQSIYQVFTGEHYAALDLDALHAVQDMYNAGELEPSSASFDPASLDPSTIAAAFGSSFIFVGSLYLVAWSAKVILSMIRR